MERDYDGISLLGMRVVVGVLFSHAVLEHFEGFVGVEGAWRWSGSSVGVGPELSGRWLSEKRDSGSLYIVESTLVVGRGRNLPCLERNTCVRVGNS